ncbi:MAG: hypothetical protein HC884_19035, partial [Chloroflexaceae bacterium]|nr:hypothetical protein [Chloroflexaceae bacterium]
TFWVLDEDEYAARGLTANEPEAHAAVVAALSELHDLAQRGWPRSAPNWLNGPVTHEVLERGR